MAVLTTLLLLATCLIPYTNGAPNKKADEELPPHQNFLKPRQNVPYQADEALFANSAPPKITGLSPNRILTALAPPAIPSAVPSGTASTASAALASAGLPSGGYGTGFLPFPIPSGIFPATGITGSSYGSGSRSSFMAYPTRGAPYQNSTALYIQPSSLPSLEAPATNIPEAQPSSLPSSTAAAANTSGGNGTDNGGQSDSGAQCPSPPTVTLPPQTITLPAETVTVTATPQTIMQTITITPQTQTQTVTITITMTAGPAPARPTAGSGGSPPNSPAAAPSNLPILSSSNAQAGIVPPINASLGNAGSGTQGSGNRGGSIPGVQPPAQTGGQGAGIPGVLPPAQTGGPALGSGQPPAPVLSAATWANKNGMAITSALPLAAISTNENGGPAPSAVPSAPLNTPISQYQGQNSVTPLIVPGSASSNVPGVRPPPQITNVPGPSGKLSKSPVAPISSGGQPVSVPPAPPSAAPYPFQNSTGPSNSLGPSVIGLVGSVPGIGPTGSGFAGPTNAPAPPVQPPLQNGSSIPIPPYQPANVSLTLAPAGSTAQVTQPASLNSSQPLPLNSTKSVNLGPVHPFTGLPAKPTLSPAPAMNMSTQEAPPLSTTSTESTCSINGTSSQNITANVRPRSPFHSNFQTNQYP